jgi:pyridoxamine 5'-phosphate oxidase-like protein
MSQATFELPQRLLDCLRAGAPVLLLTTGEDGFPNTAYTWALALDAGRVRFGADLGSATLANLQRTGRAALQIIGRDNLVFIVKGTARRVKERIAATPLRIAMMELEVVAVKDQAWRQAAVTPLAYEWQDDLRAAMQAMEQAVYAEMREWTDTPA